MPPTHPVLSVDSLKAASSTANNENNSLVLIASLVTESVTQPQSQTGLVHGRYRRIDEAAGDESEAESSLESVQVLFSLEQLQKLAGDLYNIQENEVHSIGGDGFAPYSSDDGFVTNGVPPTPPDGLKYGFVNTPEAISRRGTRTADLRRKAEKQGEMSVTTLSALGAKLLAREDEREAILDATTGVAAALLAAVELERMSTQRAACRPEVASIVTSNTETLRAFDELGRVPWDIHPERHPSVFSKAEAIGSGPFQHQHHSQNVMQHYYVRLLRLPVPVTLERISQFCARHHASIHRFVTWRRRLKSLPKSSTITIPYYGTTYATTAAGRHSNDLQLEGETLMTNWLNMFNHDDWEIWGITAMAQELVGPSNMTPLQRHRTNIGALDLEELLIDLGGSYSLNSAHGGRTSPKFDPTRLPPNEQQILQRVSVLFQEKVFAFEY